MSLVPQTIRVGTCRRRQSGLDRQQVAGVQRGQQALGLAGRFRGAGLRFQPDARDILGQVGDVLVGAAEDALPGPRVAGRHQPGREAGVQAHAGQPDRGQQRLGRHVVVRLAVGQGQRVQPLGVARREYLGDRAAGVVRDHVEVGQLERVAAVGDEAGQSGQREVLVGRGRGVAVQRQVDGHAPALAVELADHVPPQVAAGAHAVDEQHRAAGTAGVDVAGGTGPGTHLAAVLVEAFHLAGHGFSLV